MPSFSLFPTFTSEVKQMWHMYTYLLKHPFRQVILKRTYRIFVFKRLYLDFSFIYCKYTSLNTCGIKLIKLIIVWNISNLFSDASNPGRRERILRDKIFNFEEIIIGKEKLSVQVICKMRLFYRVSLSIQKSTTQPKLMRNLIIHPKWSRKIEVLSKIIRDAAKKSYFLRGRATKSFILSFLHTTQNKLIIN